MGGRSCAVPPVCAAGGASRAGGRSASFRPSAFPGQATKRVSLASFWSWGAWPPYSSGSCSPAFSGRDLCGILACWRGLACSPRFLWEPAAGAGGRVMLRLLSRAGGGGTIPHASGACGPAPPRLAGWLGGWGGGSRRGLSALPLGGGPRFPMLAPLLSLAHAPPACAFGWGRGAAPGGGGMRGGPWTAPPGAPSDLNPPSLPPESAMVMGGVMGGASPILIWCAALCRPQAWSARRSEAGGWGRWGAGCAGPAASPPPRRGPFWGREGVSSAPGGRRVAPVALKLEGGEWGRRSGGAAPQPPAPPPRGASACHPLSPARPPGGILVPWGLPGGLGRQAWPGRPPMGQCGGEGREGGGTPSPWFAPLPAPGRRLKGLFRLRCLGRRRSAVGRQRTGRERAGDSQGALAAAAVPPHPGCSGLFGGGAGQPSLRSASVRSWA